MQRRIIPRDSIRHSSYTTHLHGTAWTDYHHKHSIENNNDGGKKKKKQKHGCNSYLINADMLDAIYGINWTDHQSKLKIEICNLAASKKI